MCDMTGVLSKTMVVIILKYINLSNEHIAHPKRTQYCQLYPYCFFLIKIIYVKHLRQKKLELCHDGNVMIHLF